MITEETRLTTFPVSLVPRVIMSTLGVHPFSEKVSGPLGLVFPICNDKLTSYSPATIGSKRPATENCGAAWTLLAKVTIPIVDNFIVFLEVEE
jgi:hypothetical protein